MTSFGISLELVKIKGKKECVLMLIYYKKKETKR